MQMGNFSIYDQPAQPADMSTPLKSAVVMFEDSVRYDQLETGAFFDRNGTKLLSKQGKPRQVTFSLSDLANMQGTIFAHNHPGGGCFSPVDVMTACDLQLVELRVVTDQFRFSFRCGGGAWPASTEIVPAIANFSASARNEVKHMQHTGQLPRQHQQAELEFRLWLRVAFHFGLIFNRERS
ncbi:hypothetical protein FNU76_13470 [Chitinimonas arctica]|uniref:RadC-like JAB domain-containing protein n=1 Tax=Chitinimonas arctica TaxID=2594795 RepID=A0A516SGK0_9NEIS|nr:hypothetical protein [Chitinimonas arctica]QDQ27291.1 hypothetical protein FNU76_13470 [Chitinimonas arctica]